MTNHKILACVDPRGNTEAVIRWAAWAAVRLAAPLEFLHVLERHPERAAGADLSGTLGPDDQAALLQRLSEADAVSSRLAREQGRELLAHARAIAAAAGAGPLDARLRHGDFVETAIELQAEASLLVLGEHHHADAAQAQRAGRLHREHHLDLVIRGSTAPVLVATVQGFVPPQRIVVAFDGSPPARKALARMARHELVAGLPVHLVMVAPDSAQARGALDQAQAQLAAAGVPVSSELAVGEPQQVLPQLASARAPGLLVMGAFGHSRLRQWLLGSTTATLLRHSDMPVLILR